MGGGRRPPRPLRLYARRSRRSRSGAQVIAAGAVSDEEREERRSRCHPLDAQAAGGDAVEQAGQVRGAGELDTDQRRSGLAVALLDVLEQRDVVLRPEDAVEEAAE